MSTQSYPWFKFAHVEYLLDPIISTMSLAAQGANTRLMAYAARQLPYGTLPNDEKTLLAMSGAKSLKQWQKLHNELMGSTWFVNDDNRWFCPLMIVESAPTAEQEPQEEPKKALTSAERQAAYKARQKELALLAEQSNATGNEEVTLGNGASNAQVTGGNGASNEKVTTGNAQVTGVSLLLGGKGGDLDSELKQDLDLKQELKTTLSKNASDDKPLRFFDDELRPDLKTLNAKLGANLIDQKFIDENLFSFNSHFETKPLTDNQRLAKWIAWWRGEEAKKQAQAIKRPSKEKIFGNVNDDFPIVNHQMLTPEEIAANKEKLNDLPF